jgi:hypothetical protein
VVGHSGRSCFEDWILFFVGTLVPHPGPTTGTNDWNRRLGPTTGTNDRDQQLGQTTGTDDWDQRLGPTTGTDDWDRPLGPTTGTDDRRQGPTTGTDDLDQRLGPTTRTDDWDGRFVNKLMNNYLFIDLISKHMLPCHAPGQGSTVAAAGPGHGQVALETNPGAWPWGPQGSRSFGWPWLLIHLAMAWTRLRHRAAQACGMA